MKSIGLIFICGILYISAFSQVEQTNKVSRKDCITVGFLQGGGSIIGIDYETLIAERLGIQLGAGFLGYGGGINYHIRPYLRSSYFSLNYWNQGIGSKFTQNLVGATFVYRGKKWFTCQLGVGAVISKGPAWPTTTKQPPIQLLYSVGAYILN